MLARQFVENHKRKLRKCRGKHETLVPRRRKPLRPPLFPPNRETLHRLEEAQATSGDKLTTQQFNANVAARKCATGILTKVIEKRLGEVGDEGRRATVLIDEAEIIIDYLVRSYSVAQYFHFIHGGLLAFTAARAILYMVSDDILRVGSTSSTSHIYFKHSIKYEPPAETMSKLREYERELRDSDETDMLGLNDIDLIDEARQHAAHLINELQVVGMRGEGDAGSEEGRQAVARRRVAEALRKEQLQISRNDALDDLFRLSNCLMSCVTRVMAETQHPDAKSKKTQNRPTTEAIKSTQTYIYHACHYQTQIAKTAISIDTLREQITCIDSTTMRQIEFEQPTGECSRGGETGGGGVLLTFPPDPHQLAAFRHEMRQNLIPMTEKEIAKLEGCLNDIDRKVDEAVATMLRSATGRDQDWFRRRCGSLAKDLAIAYAMFQMFHCLHSTTIVVAATTCLANRHNPPLHLVRNEKLDQQVAAYEREAVAEQSELRLVARQGGFVAQVAADANILIDKSLVGGLRDNCLESGAFDIITRLSPRSRITHPHFNTLKRQIGMFINDEVAAAIGRLLHEKLSKLSEINRLIIDPGVGETEFKYGRDVRLRSEGLMREEAGDSKVAKEIELGVEFEEAQRRFAVIDELLVRLFGYFDQLDSSLFDQPDPNIIDDSLRVKIRETIDIVNNDQ